MGEIEAGQPHQNTPITPTLDERFLEVFQALLNTANEVSVGEFTVMKIGKQYKVGFFYIYDHPEADYMATSENLMEALRMALSAPHKYTHEGINDRGYTYDEDATR